MTITVNNCITECNDGRRTERDLETLTSGMHHRISFARDDGGEAWGDVEPIPDAALTGPLVSERFHDTRRHRGDGERDYRDRPGVVTGGATPYQFVGRTDGTIDQCLEVADYGPHARRWSWFAMATAWVGDFRRHPPTRQQWAAAIEWAALWAAWGAAPVGHDEASGGSLHQSKQCPGAFWGMGALRLEVRGHPHSKLTIDEAELRLHDLGVVF